MRWPSAADEPVWRWRMAARIGTVRPIVFVWALCSWGITALTGPMWFHDLPSIVLPLCTNGLLVLCIVGERLLRGEHINEPHEGLWRGGLALAALLLLAGLVSTIVGVGIAATSGSLPR